MASRHEDNPGVHRIATHPTDYRPPSDEGAPPDGGHYETKAEKPDRFGRVTPHDVGAEQSTLGAMLLSPIAVLDVLNTGLRAGDFFSPSHQTIYDAALDLNAAGEPVDVQTVASFIEAMGTPHPMGTKWATELIEIQAGTPTIKNAGAYARIVRERATSRTAIAALSNAVEDASRLLYAGHAPTEALGGVITALSEVSASTSATAGSWAPIDLAKQDVVVELPYLVQRTDGAALFYMGKVNSLAGPPESAKSWLALMGVAECAKRGEHAVYIDYEDDPTSISGRLRAMGCTDEDLGHVTYYWPESGIEHALAAVLALKVDVSLIVVDSNTRATLASGGATNSTDDAAAIGNVLMQLSRQTGAGTVLLDHVTKDDDPDSPYSRGAGDKLAYINGAAYKVKRTALFAPGREGKSEITCVKDRPGGARRNFAGAKTAGVFTLASDEDGTTATVALHPLDAPTTTGAGDFRPTYYMEKISRALELAPAGLSARQVRDAVPGKKGTYKDAALKALVAEGYVAPPEKVGNSHIYRSVKPFRENETPAEEAPAHTDEEAF